MALVMPLAGKLSDRWGGGPLALIGVVVTTIASIPFVGGSIGTAVLAVVLQRALSGTHTLAGAASAYGTALWAAGGLTALAIVPCIILLRAERCAAAPACPRSARPAYPSGQRRHEPVVAQLLRRRAVQYPVAMVAAAHRAVARELAHGGGDGGTVSADKVGEALVAERQR
jgi:hypothetical protein